MNKSDLPDKEALEEKLKGAEPHILIEILYEYLSQHISTLFEKMVEGLDTLHDSFNDRRREHEQILQRIEQIEQRLAVIEKNTTG